MKTAKFQSFEHPSSPEKGPERLVALRAEMEKNNLDGFIVPVPICIRRICGTA